MSTTPSADTDAREPDAPVPTAPRSRGRYARAIRTPRGAIGLGLVAFVILASVLGPFVFTHGPFEQGPDSLQSPSGQYPLGTDELGRDLLARVFAGTRVDLIITLIAVPVAAVIGTLLGLVAVVSRTLDAIVQRIFDVLIGVPAVILGIGVAIAIAPGMESVMIAIALVTMPIFGRQARGALLGQLSQDYVAAAEVLGYPRRRIMVRHILPNIIDVIFVRFAVEMAHAIMIEGGLSVVGLGIQPPQPSLGSMIKDGSSYLFETPLYALAPIFVVMLLVVGYFMLSDALNKAVLRQ